MKTKGPMTISEGINAFAAMAFQGRKAGRRVRRYPMLKTGLSGGRPRRIFWA